MLSALLIQLFGREVIDRLSAAGFGTAGSIASAGAERLSEQGGIPVALARRIIAVAMEDPGDADPPAEDVPQPIPDPTSEAPAAGENPERHVRRPFKRPHSPFAADAARVKEPGSKRKGTRRRPEPEPDPGPDPFVDDVGLVSWMGSAARGGPHSAGSFAVADEILDPGPSILDAEPDAGPASRPEAPAADPISARPPPRPATPQPPAPPLAAPRPAGPAPGVPTLAGPGPSELKRARLEPGEAKKVTPLPPAREPAAGSAPAGEPRPAR